MPREFSRRARVAEQIQRELGRLITTELRDPRVRLVTVTDVDLSPDLKNAKVYIGVLEMAADPEQALLGLRHAARFLRTRLGKSLRLRVVPELRFIEDSTERDAQHMSALIDRVVAEDTRRHDDDG